MSAPWPAGPSGSVPELNLLDDLLLDIDDKTLQCLTGGNPLPPMPVEEQPDSNGGASSSGKRRRQEHQLNQWLNSEFGGDANNEEEEDDDDGSGDNQPSRKSKVGRKGKPMSTAAVAKAEREKQRRERLNEYVDELARLCDPSGKTNKNNRINVVCDAIRVIQQLRVENNQLKQLNKFLEERVGMFERAKAQTMYQQAMAHQASMTMQHTQMMARQQPPAATTQTSDIPSTSAAAAAATQQQQQQQQPQQQQQQQPQMMAMPDMQHMMPGMHMVSAPMMYTTMPMPAPMYAVKQETGAVIAGASTATAEQTLDVTMPLPANAPPVGFLPAPDLNKDEKLRPPAA